jgi:hypothetical protein
MSLYAHLELQRNNYAVCVLGTNQTTLNYVAERLQLSTSWHERQLKFHCSTFEQAHALVNQVMLIADKIHQVAKQIHALPLHSSSEFTGASLCFLRITGPLNFPLLALSLLREPDRAKLALLYTLYSHEKLEESWPLFFLYSHDVIDHISKIFYTIHRKRPVFARSEWLPPTCYQPLATILQRRALADGAWQVALSGNNADEIALYYAMTDGSYAGHNNPPDLSCHYFYCDKEEESLLLIQELRAIQAKIGKTPPKPACTFIDKREGRYYVCVVGNDVETLERILEQQPTEASESSVPIRLCPSPSIEEAYVLHCTLSERIPSPAAAPLISFHAPPPYDMKAQLQKRGNTFYVEVLGQDAPLFLQHRWICNQANPSASLEEGTALIEQLQRCVSDLHPPTSSASSLAEIQRSHLDTLLSPLNTQERMRLAQWCLRQDRPWTLDHLSALGITPEALRERPLPLNPEELELAQLHHVNKIHRSLTKD